MSRFFAMRERRMAALVTAAVVVISSGCREEALQRGPGDTGSQAAGLTPKQASLVLAKVGDRPITLGDFAATLERMDRFDRHRYKTPERRRELLEEMITTELLAREAERRGLHKEPRTQEALRQILRDAIVREAREDARGPSDFTKAEVEVYYNAHKKDYLEPERRRVSHLVVGDREEAGELLAEARGLTSAVAWGKLVLEHSDDYDGAELTGPIETAGDLGLVGPPGDRRGANPRVPDQLRKAVFEIQNVGDVLAKLVKGPKGKFHILRLSGMTNAHARSLQEAERTIRIVMSQQEVAAREQQLEAELRKKFSVTIDDEALADVKVPKPEKTPPGPPVPSASKSSQPKPPSSGSGDHGHAH